MAIKFKKLPKHLKTFARKNPNCEICAHGIGEDGRMRTLFAVKKNGDARKISIPFAPHQPISQKQLREKLEL